MKEKYYTPSIEEFHIGFEYEFLVRDNIWQNEIYGADKPAQGWMLPMNMNGDFIDKYVRVKYLDREDIESLGWKYFKNEYTIGSYYIFCQIEFQNIKIEREYEDIIMGNHTNWRDIIFEGKIKNKNELKKLMRMLEI